MSRSPQIDEIDARMLLLLADELPAEESRRLREQLRADAKLAGRLRRLEEDLGTVGSLLADADEASPLRPVQVSRASASAQREVRAWALGVRREMAERAAAAQNGSAVWRWTRWPLTAAAVLVAGLILWTFHDSIGPSEPSPIAIVTPVQTDASGERLNQRVSPSFAQPEMDGPPGQTPDDVGGRDAVAEGSDVTRPRAPRRGDPVAEALLLESLFAGPNEGGEASADALADALRLSELGSQLVALRWLDLPDDDDF